MPLKIIESDIRRVEADAVIGILNPLMAETSGNVWMTGDITITPAQDMNAEYVLKMIGSPWTYGNLEQRQGLQYCFETVMYVAAVRGWKRIAVPLMNMRQYGYPRIESLEYLIAAVQGIAEEREMEILLVISPDNPVELKTEVAKKIKQYVKSRCHEQSRAIEVLRNFIGLNRLEEWDEEVKYICDSCDYKIGEITNARNVQCEINLDNVLINAGESFRRKLLRMIDERGMSDNEVYKAANLDRKLFSKIRCSDDYHPRKKTVLSLAIALRLDLNETAELLKSAGMAISSSSKAELVVEYCICHKIYDIHAVNLILFEYGLPTLSD